MPWYLGNSSMYSFQSWWGAPVAFIAIWSIFWTGLALWHAARRSEKWWFIFFLIVHTAGIVEILYLLFVVHAFSNKPSHRRSR